MKKNLIVLLLICSVASNAQNMRAYLDGGYSLGNAPLAGCGFGYNLKGFVLNAGVQSHMSSKVNLGAFFNLSLGKEINIIEKYYIVPSIGASYNHCSSDIKSLNQSRPLYSVEIEKEILPNELRVGIVGSVTGKFNLLSIRIKGIF